MLKDHFAALKRVRTENSIEATRPPQHARSIAEEARLFLKERRHARSVEERERERKDCKELGVQEALIPRKKDIAFLKEEPMAHGLLLDFNAFKARQVAPTLKMEDPLACRLLSDFHAFKTRQGTALNAEELRVCEETSWYEEDSTQLYRWNMAMSVINLEHKLAHSGTQINYLPSQIHKRRRANPRLFAGLFDQKLA